MMRRCLLVSVVLVGVLLLVSAAADQHDTTQVLSRGESITKALATVTSTAISPLLGVSVMGAWQYFRTPKAQRGQLPFFDRPYFWIPTVALLVLIFIKDTFGGFAPLIKKPLDAIEVLFVNHAALILIVFPVVMNQVARECMRQRSTLRARTTPSVWLQHCSTRRSGSQLLAWCGCWDTASMSWR